MPRTRPLISLLFLAAVASLISTQTAAQEMKPTGLSEWDSSNQVPQMNFGDRVPRYSSASSANAIVAANRVPDKICTERAIGIFEDKIDLITYTLAIPQRFRNRHPSFAFKG